MKNELFFFKTLTFDGCLAKYRLYMPFLRQYQMLPLLSTCLYFIGRRRVGVSKCSGRPIFNIFYQIKFDLRGGLTLLTRNLSFNSDVRQ